MITLTLLTLVAIPTFYEILDGLRGRFGHLARRALGSQTIDSIQAATGEHRVGP